MSGAGSGPVGEKSRAEILDVLRGFALLGILVSHVPTFSGYEFLPADRQAELDGWGIDRGLKVGVEFLVRGKFLSLFSLLFGIGFAIQIESAVRQSVHFAARFTRRMAVLLAIGILHTLVWFGDILIYYAVFGLLLLPMARWDARRMLRASAVGFSVRLLWGVLALALASVLTSLAPESLLGESGEPDTAGGLFQLFQSIGGERLGTSFLANLEFFKLKVLQMIYDGKFISIFAMFLLGASIGKYGVFRDLEGNRQLLWRVLLVAGPLGLIGNAILVPLHAAVLPFPPTPLRALDNGVFAIAVPALTLAYAAGLSLLWLRHGARPWLRWLAPPGRMALTTYLSQTAVLVLLFYGYGLGWMFEIGQLGCLLLALLIFAAQCVASRLWLVYFRFGPVEWAWRCATYGALLRIRHAADVKTPA